MQKGSDTKRSNGRKKKYVNVKALARAYRWKRKLDEGTFATVGELAKAERINESYVTRILRLNLLAPDIIEAALNGQSNLTVQSITESVSVIWEEQRLVFAARSSN
jgi:hypothetical protein